MGEDMTGKKLPWKQRLKDHVEFASSMILTMSTVLGLVWLFARNEVQEWVQALVGQNEIVERTDQQFEQITEQLRVLQNVSSANAQAIKSLLPPPRVAEYDLLRTRVFTPCALKSDCQFQVRARRTEYGLDCGPPTVDARIVIDRYGLQHIVLPGAMTSTPSRLDGEWRSISASFIVQREIPLGVAEFMLRLAYECPANGSGRTQTIYEYTPRMAFEVIG